MLMQNTFEKGILKKLRSVCLEKDDIQKYVDCVLYSTKPLSLDEFFFLVNGNAVQRNSNFDFTVTVCVYNNFPEFSEKDALGIAFKTSFKDMASFEEFMMSRTHLEVDKNAQIGFLMPDGIKMTTATLKSTCVIPRGYISDVRISEGKSIGFCRGVQKLSRALKSLSFGKTLSFAS